jgi:oligopeptide transport system ATP-binding protein
MVNYNDKPILEVNNLRVQFNTRDGFLRAVRGVTFNLYPGESLGLVGESGCGKSVSALSILRLIQCPPGKIEADHLNFDGTDLLQTTKKDLRKIRGNRISMIFQDPMTSLNPVLSIEKQMSEVMKLHLDLGKQKIWDRCIDLLEMVGVSAPEMRLKSYPHQLSGGMRQRVMIAMAISCRPNILLADEPTTALDVTIQDQILNLMGSLARELDMATILITHNFGAVSGNTDRIIVMYAGQIVEMATTMELFHNPLHPYTRSLLASIPKVEEEEQSRLFSIKGMVPSLLQEIEGCTYAPRCEIAGHECTTNTPSFDEKAEAHYASCWKV